MGGVEETIREEVSDILGRELPDSVWRRAYAEAQKKLRHIVTMYGDAGGARNSEGYMAQIVAEAVKARAIAEYTAASGENGRGPAQRPAPRDTHPFYCA